WLCKSADDEDGVLRPCWKPPESITDFYPPPHLSDHERWRSRATASAKFSELLQTLPSLTDAEISRRHQRAPCALAGDAQRNPAWIPDRAIGSHNGQIQSGRGVGRYSFGRSPEGYFSNTPS